MLGGRAAASGGSGPTQLRGAVGGPRLTVGAASSSIRPQVDALFSSRSEITPAKIPPATQRGEARSGPGPQGKSPSRGRRGYKTEAIRESCPPLCPWPCPRPRSPLAVGYSSEQAPAVVGRQGRPGGISQGDRRQVWGLGPGWPRSPFTAMALILLRPPTSRRAPAPQGAPLRALSQMRDRGPSPRGKAIRPLG